MKRIFIGLIFVFFDFNLNFGASTLGLIPDFIGFFLIWKGCGEIAELSENFKNAQKPCVFLMLITALQYCSNLLGSPIERFNVFLVVIYTLVITGILIYVMYLITYGMVDVELNADSGAMRTSRLVTAWKTKAVSEIMALISVLLLPSLTDILIVVAFAASVCYLVFFHTAWKTYETTETHE